MMFAWQGWQLQTPDQWNPVNLHGTFEAGYALLSDIHRPRLGIRWSTPGRGFDSNRWSREALVAEIGQLAANEAEECGDDRFRSAFLYSEPEPPGRDVFLGISSVSGRTFEIVHHVYPGEASKMKELRERFSDSACEAELAWAAFDLTCATAGGWRLASHRMNAGDLGLEFARKSERMSLRQIAVAHLALKRMPLEKWLDEQIRPWMKRYSRVGDAAAVTIPTIDGRVLEGVSCRLQRRRLMIWGAPMATIYLAALHDAKRDRLVLVEAKDESQAGELARSIGWANQEVLC
jgi:hypothetical protein